MNLNLKNLFYSGKLLEHIKRKPADRDPAVQPMDINSVTIDSASQDYYSRSCWGELALVDGLCCAKVRY